MERGCVLKLFRICSYKVNMVLWSVLGADETEREGGFGLTGGLNDVGFCSGLRTINS